MKKKINMKINKAIAAVLSTAVVTGTVSVNTFFVSAADTGSVQVEAEQKAATSTSGKWGSCNWSFANGVLTINGGIGGYWNPWIGISSEINRIDIKGKVTFDKNTSLSALFMDFKNLKQITGLDKFDTTNVVNMSNMFSGCSSLTSLDLSKFNTKNVTDMHYMFQGCTNLSSINLTGFVTANVTDMRCMFASCSSLQSLNLSSFNTGNVTDMGSMFNYCSGLKSLNLSNFNLGNVQSTSYMFYYCSSFNDIVMPKNLGSSSVQKQFVDGVLQFMSDSPWTDVTANKKYAGKPNTLIAGHRYITGSPSVSLSKKDNGSSITFTANAAGGAGGYTYKFIVYNKSTKSWGLVQNFSSKNTCIWPKGSIGDREFFVDVKDKSGKVVRSNVVNVNITKPSASLTASATSVNSGSNITFTAKASGGTGGYKYKFLVHNKNNDQWAKLQDFSANNKINWTAVSAGNREFFVDVKDSKGNVSRSKVVNVSVKAVPLSIKATASTTSNKVNGKVTFKAAASGGSGGYTYKFLVHNKDTDKWSKLQDFSGNNTITWTALSAGNREFFVDVKDSKGRVVRSAAMNVKTSK